MEIKYEFTPDEVMRDFKLIGETFKRGIVKTGRGRRLYEQMIVSKGHDDIAVELINRGKYAHSHGLRGGTVMTSEQILVLKELVAYCMEL